MLEPFFYMFTTIFLDLYTVSYFNVDYTSKFLLKQYLEERYKILETIAYNVDLY